MNDLNATISAAQGDMQERNPLPAMEPLAAPQYPTDQETVAKQKQVREAAVAQEDSLSVGPEGLKLGGYLNRMWSQDGFVEGLVAKSVGWEMQPDSNWMPFQPDNWKMLTEGLPEEFHNQFLNTTSQQHALFTRDLLIKKMDDMQNLGDLGTKGNVGRLAFGLVEPSNLLVGIASGGTTTALKAGKTAVNAQRLINSASKLEQGAFKLKALEEATTALASAAKKDKGIGAIAGGLAVGTGTGYGFEKLRQAVNFEDSEVQAVEAGLMALAFSAPFVGVHAWEMNRLTTVAGKELQVLRALQKGTVSAEDLKSYKAVQDKVMSTELVPLKDQEVATISRPLEGEYVPFTAPEKPASLPHGSIEGQAVRTEDNTLARQLLTGPEGSIKTPEAATPKAIEGKPGVVDATVVSEGPGAPPAEPLVGKQVSFNGFEAGTVIKELGQNRLLVEDGHTGERRVISREDLHQESPGFVPTEAPDGFEPGSVGAAQAIPIQRGVDPTYLANGRLDIYKTLNTSPNSVIQELGHLLVKDAIGNSKTDAQGWSASERKRHFVRSIGGYFHSEAKEAFTEARKVRGWGIREALKNHREFYENVSRVTAGDRQVLIDNPDIAPMLQKASAAQKHVYSQMLEKAKLAGVEGTENLPPKDTYVNRVWRQENLREAISTHGEAAVYKMVANAIRTPGLVGDATKAEQFVKAIIKLEHSHVMQDMKLAARDMKTLREELASAKLSQGEIDSIVDLLFERKAQESDAGLPGNLKSRFNLDETYNEKMADGSTFGIRDLLENDSRVLVDKYLNSMAGHTALAEKGVTSRAEWRRRVAEAESFHDPMVHSADQYKDHVQLVQDMYDNITGRPMSTQSYGKADRFLASFRAYARSTYLGQLGVAAAFEMKNAIGLATIRSAWTQMPSFANFVRAVRSGHIPGDKLAADIRMMSGFGTERAASYTRQHEATDFTYDRQLSRFETVGNEASHYVDIMSGNQFFTSFTRGLSAKMFIQKYADLATGKKALSSKARERLVHQGIDDHRINYVLKQLKENTKRDPSGRVEEIDWESWSQNDPQSYSDFQLALSRSVRDAIQEHDIGETLAFQHTTLGKVITELKVFAIAAHSKQFLKGIHYRDSTTAMTWMMSFVGESMAYTLQTSLNYSHNPEELGKRLTLDRISRAAVARMSVLGVVPMLLDTPYKAVTGNPLFSGQGMTNNTDNRDLFATPSTLLAQRALGTVQAGAQALSPFSNTVTTSSEVKNAFSLLPGSNLWLMRNLNDYVSSGFPKHELKASQ